MESIFQSTACKRHHISSLKVERRSGLLAKEEQNSRQKKMLYMLNVCCRQKKLKFRVKKVEKSTQLEM